MRVKWDRTFSAFILIVIASVAPALVSGGSFVTVQSLTEDLRSRDINRIDKTLNDIKAMPSKGEILPFIMELWDQRNERHPDLPWDVIGTEVIRVELADIILQAVKNGRLRVDPKPMHSFVSKSVNSNDPDVARKAIGALAIIDDETDVDKILGVAKRNDPTTFRAAVATLTQMCNERAARAIADLEVSTKDDTLRSYVRQRKHDSDEFKKRTTWCSSYKPGLEQR
jgi:HEAT repeat protein